MGRFRVCSGDKAATGWDVAGRNAGVKDDAQVLAEAPEGPLTGPGKTGGQTQICSSADGVKTNRILFGTYYVKDASQISKDIRGGPWVKKSGEEV